jgi:TonB family protein
LCSAGFVPAFADREKPVVVPQSKPFRSGKILNAFDRVSPAETSSSGSGNVSRDPSGNLDESTALASLKELIAAGDHRLEPMLATITDAARQLTGASGAALAMWKEGAMVCRARSGDTAPALGARLSADTGISGECLRTGKIQHCTDTENDPLVDVEVCRSLGLRSIAVLPIQGWRGVNGILEVFSTKPAAFSEQHIALLQQLAALAERARASQPHAASPAAPKLPSATEQRHPSRILPASDRVGDVALAFLGNRSRPLVLGAVGLAVISLLALVIWIGWRGPDETNGKAHAATPASVNAGVNSVTAHPSDQRPPDNDLVWKPNPGGESLFPSRGRTSAGTPVKFAAKVDVIASKKIQADRSQVDLSLLLGDAAIPREVPGSQIGSQSDSRSTDSHTEETTSAEPPAIAAETNEPGANQSALNGVLSAKASLPGLSAPVSQGVSGGQLVHHVLPVYPAQALLLRLEGTVILAATVMEDGTVRDIKVVEGSPVLTQSAVEAVKYWRYKPYELDGKPVKNEITITVDFKFPSSAASR